MMDTATINNGEWIIRPLRSGEFEAIKEMAKDLAFVVSPIVILPPNAAQMGYAGLGARQWDSNIDTVFRELLERSVTFIQPHAL